MVKHGERLLFADCNSMNVKYIAHFYALDRFQYGDVSYINKTYYIAMFRATIVQ